MTKPTKPYNEKNNSLEYHCSDNRNNTGNNEFAPNFRNNNSRSCSKQVRNHVQGSSHRGRVNNSQNLNRRGGFPNHRRNNHTHEDFSRSGRAFNRASPYDTRSRQSSIACKNRYSQEENRALSSQVSNATNRPPVDSISAAWDDSTIENCEEDIGKCQSAVAKNPLKEISKNETDDDEVVWIISENSESLNMTTVRKSPLDFLDEDNRKIVRSDNNNQGKSRAPRGASRDEDEFFKDNANEYKGISFSPPFPIVPVSSATDQPPSSSVNRFFENDSRSSAQSFEQLSKLAKSLWKDSTDVPLDWASEQVMDPEKYMKTSNERLKESPKESSKENYTESSMRVKRDEKVERRIFSRYVSRVLKENKLFEEKAPTRMNNDNTIVKETEETSTFTSTTIIEIEQIKSTKEEKARNIKSTQDEERARIIVDGISRADNVQWLDSTLSNVHILLPNVIFFDNATIQKLLKILSSPIVLNTSAHAKKLIKYFVDKPGFLEKIFSYMSTDVICGSDFLPIVKLTEFIIDHFPSDATEIPYDYINDIYIRVRNTFYNESDSKEVNRILEKIPRRIGYTKRLAIQGISGQSNAIAAAQKNVADQKNVTARNNIGDQRKATDRNIITDRNSIADQRKVTDQKKVSSKLPKPDWIIYHSESYVERPLIPLSDEIFNLKDMMARPKLTPNLANRSWLPENEEIYRQVHYDLLRTEILEDLQRASISFFAAHCQDYSISVDSPFNNYVFYYDVRIVNTTVDKNFTPCVKVGFKTSRPVDWIKGEHLIYGTFVLLFKVKNELNNVSADILTMTWAVVEHLSLDEVSRPNGDNNTYLESESFVGLNFSSSEFEKLDINGKYVMLESTRNYASIGPVMEWLKESNIQRFFPLYRELFTCDLGKGKVTPGYLENVSFDISSILVGQRRPTAIKDLSQWPTYMNRHGIPAYNMELSCVVALRHIISHKVAVITAPIVTSKAKVASRAVEFLNQAAGQSHCHEPIFILTRSSYALDSILEQLLPSFPELIRCGSLSKIKNSALHARQIQDVIAENSKKTTLRRGWSNICCNEMISKQRELAELWKLRNYALSLEYFVETSPKAFRDQLVPGNMRARYKPLGFKSEKVMFVRLLELWLSGISVNEIDKSLYSHDVQVHPENNFPTRRRNNLYQTGTSPTNSRVWSNVVQSFNRPHRGTWSFDAQVSSLFDELSKSHLFENDWSKSNGCNDDEISLPSDFDKEILDHQTDDRVISKFEEGNINVNLNYSKYKTEFTDVARGFWGNSGKNIWEMESDKRKILYDRFCQRHIEFFDPKIRNLQMDAISEAEKAKSALNARWIEVCSFAPVIGMTVSYATAHRELLTTIKPRICIVDEASEILESQLMFLISSDRLEHLIMFGDIQYSKPDVKSYTTQKHGLDVSLFERWIKCDGKFVCLNQQSRMHPAVHELVQTFYDEEEIKNVVSKNLPEIIGVPSHVFFMTHNNFEDRGWTSFKKTNIFEARFIAKFAFYLYQQGYDPAKITILTPYLGQKILILNSLGPELKKDLKNENIYGRFDKERNQTGRIKVELIDNYSSEENEIVLLSLVSVSRNWHEAALKTLNNKKRAIIALSRALHALYIFGNEELLCKSEIWNPVVKKLAKKKEAFGKSLILSCSTHVNQKIEIETIEDFTTKVPYGGCSEPCLGLLKCGHVCPRKCHPIHHNKEVNYICERPCGGQFKECEHTCPKKCFECVRSGKCPPCDQSVRVRLSCGHVNIMTCRRAKSNIDKMAMECREKKMFTFNNCGHSSMLPCSTRLPICQEACGKSFPCGHRCQRQCGVEHQHDRSDCLSECTKTLICGHQCANGCSEPDRHTSFCNKQCRIKCMHGHMCPRTCHEACTRCLEPCPWKCPHYRCTKKCSDFCNRPPCNKRCQHMFRCGHQCNGYCGEKCPPCLKCNPNIRCNISLLALSDMEVNERLYMLPECKCVFTAEGLDLYFANQVKNGDHTAVKLWQCPSCQEPIFTAMRYNRYLKVEINLWNIIKRKQELARNSLSAEERSQIINAMNEETRTTDFNSMVGGRWFVCPNNHPYYIGNCGGATQISKCPDCSATIGGTQHRVVASNRFYGEFDNSASPAWPGQH